MGSSAPTLPAVQASFTLSDPHEFPALGETPPARSHKSGSPIKKRIQTPKRASVVAAKVSLGSPDSPVGSTLGSISDSSATASSSASYSPVPQGRELGGTTYYDNPGISPDTSMFDCSVEPTGYSEDSLPLPSEAIHQQMSEYRNTCRALGNMGGVILDDLVYHLPLGEDMLGGKKVTVFYARNSISGKMHIVRRVHELHLRNLMAVNIANKWAGMEHPNIVRLDSIATERWSGEGTVLFVYDFHLGAISLDEFLQQQSTISEDLIWSFVVQLASALQTIHEHGLAARCLDASNILLTSFDHGALRINSGAIVDVLDIADRPESECRRLYSHSYAVDPALQHADLLQFGHVISLLAMRWPSSDIVELASALKLGKITSAAEVVRTVATRGMGYMVSLQEQKDLLVQELAKELESSRLLKLLMMLLNVDRYLEEGGVASDTALILRAFHNLLFRKPHHEEFSAVLSKLDLGTDEMVPLQCDRQTLMLISYRELKDYLAGAHVELLATCHAAGPIS